MSDCIVDRVVGRVVYLRFIDIGGAWMTVMDTLGFAYDHRHALGCSKLFMQSTVWLVRVVQVVMERGHIMVIKFVQVRSGMMGRRNWSCKFAVLAYRAEHGRCDNRDGLVLFLQFGSSPRVISLKLMKMVRQFIVLCCIAETHEFRDLPKGI